MLELRATGPEAGQGWRQCLSPDVPVCVGHAPADGTSIPWDSQLSDEHFVIWLQDGTVQVSLLNEFSAPIECGTRRLVRASLRPDSSFHVGSTRFELAKPAVTIGTFEDLDAESSGPADSEELDASAEDIDELHLSIGSFRLEERLQVLDDLRFVDAWDLTHDRPVSILRIRSPQAADRLRILSAVDHPRVARIYGVGSLLNSVSGSDGDGLSESDVGMYASVERQEGPTLKELLVHSPTFAVDIALSICYELVEGLSVLHGVGLYGIRLNPSTILCNPQKVEERGDADADGTVAETAWTVRILEHSVIQSNGAELSAEQELLDYAAPELRQSAAASPQADFYAVGVLLFRMLCGRRPFGGSHPAVLLQQQLYGPPVDPRRLRPELPRRLNQLVLRLQMKDPDRRPRSSHELLIELAAVSQRKRWWNSLAPLRRARLPKSRGWPDTAGVPRRSGRDSTSVEADAFSSAVVVSLYPAPIALAYRRFCQWEDEGARFQALVYAAEASVRYLVTLGVSDLLRTRRRRGDVGLPDRTELDFLRAPKAMSLGNWVATLREVAREAGERPGIFVPELAEVCAPDGALLNHLLSEIVRNRNVVAHQKGSLALTPTEARQACRDLRPLLENLIKQIAFTRRYPLGFVKSIGSRSEERKVVGYHLHSCMGVAPRPRQYLNIPEQLRRLFEFLPEVPFVVDPVDDRLMYLWPMLQQYESEQTTRPTLFVFESITRRANGLSGIVEIEAASVESRRDTHNCPVPDVPATREDWLIERTKPYRLRRHVSAPKGLQIARSLLSGTTDDMQGRRLGEYVLRHEIGEGGFARVYLAENSQQVFRAVKILKSEYIHDRQMERFELEFEKLRAAGRHDGIVRCFEYAIDEHTGSPWYSMEYAAGGDLGLRIHERKPGRQEPIPWSNPLTRQQIIGEFRRIVTAISYLHEELSLVHRDIKPSNVLIMEDGRLKLSDFGLVKSMRATSRVIASSAGAVVGTPWYMAPEQERAEDVDERTDVYSLGIMLGELASGRPPQPRTGLESGSTLRAWKRLQTLPSPVRTVIIKATGVQPHKRYPSARSLLEAFNEGVSQKES